MTEYFKDIINYKKERTNIIINYNAKKGTSLVFNNSKLKNIQVKTINSIIQQINSLENKDQYFDLMNTLMKELSYRSLIGNTSIKSNNNTHCNIDLFDFIVNFYYYEYINDNYVVSKIETIKVSLIQKNKWYNYYILVNDIYTGIDLNFVSINSVQGYSPRTQIGMAYYKYINNTVPIEDNIINKNNKIAKIPINSKGLFKTILKNHVYSINKYTSRDELTELNLI